jgi:kanamycin kinase/aminoglycoside 3'-phosphotransferase-2
MEQFFIDWVKKQLRESVEIKREPHGDQSDVYHLVAPKGNYFLKIAPTLTKERERLVWLDGKLPVPRVIGFTRAGEKDGLLLSAVEGVDLAKLGKEWPVDKVVKKLAEALRRFHSTAAKDCPFGIASKNMVLVHGDACLPNFIFKGDALSGYVDLGDVRVDFPEVDFSAAIWSLQHNLGPGYGLKFLKEYGIKNATEKLAEELRLHYEDMREAWGLVSEKQ